MNDSTMPEVTQPKIFHIHLDTDTASSGLHHKIQKELRFFPHHFSGHPSGRTHFEPTSHSSVKIRTKKEFDQVWGKAIAMVSAEKNVVGYLEGEFIPLDLAIPFKEIGNFFPPPFKIKRRVLDSGKGEMFRETEFHLVMDCDNSDQRVIESLMDAGLYGALLSKTDHKAIVLTIQGHRRFIKPLIQSVIMYLNQVGGVARCTIKEEEALTNKLFNKKVETLPPIIEELVLR